MSLWFVNCLRLAVIVGLLVNLPGYSARGQSQGDKRLGESRAAMAVLERPDANDFEKAKACQALAHIGDKEAVPALADLLDDPELSNYARQALEGIADPTAAEALRNALGTTQGDRRIGIVASLGRKADVEAIARLTDLLTDENDRLAAAAANSLGEIGTSQCAEALLSSLKKSDERRAVDLAQAALKSGQQLMRRGESEAAVRLFEQLSSNEKLPSFIAAGCTVARATALSADSLPWLISELPSRDLVRFQAVATSLGVLASQLTSQQLALLLESIAPLDAERRALILQSLAPSINLEVVKDHSPIQIRHWAGTPEPELQAACLPLLAYSERPEDVQTVVDAAASHHPVVSAAARQAIEDCSTRRFDAAILRMLEDDDAERLKAAIDLAARRRLSAAADRLTAIVSDARHPARLLAVTALGSTIDSRGLARLLEFATADGANDVREAARDGLRVAFVRLPQTESARALEKLWHGGNLEAKIYALDRLGEVGGPTALETLEQAVLSREPAMQDAGSRVLGEWMSPDAAPLLLKLARTLDDSKLKLRSLRGALRIARQLDMPLKDRLALCQQALQLSSRDDERKLVLDIYRQYASPDTLSASFELASRDSMREAAIAAAQAIAPRAALQDASATRAALDKAIASAKSSEVKQQATVLRQALNTNATR